MTKVGSSRTGDDFIPAIVIEQIFLNESIGAFLHENSSGEPVGGVSIGYQIAAYRCVGVWCSLERQAAAVESECAVFQ
jgi:hypothetical protein